MPADPSELVMRMTIGPVGDRAGEHLHLHRGRYDAWIHVIIGFIYAALLLGGTLGLLAGAGVGKLIDAVSTDRHTLEMGIYITAGVVGIGGAIMIFRDRWRCTEAVASRYCSGLANLSMLYVPIVAFVYASYRGVMKLRGE